MYSQCYRFHPNRFTFGGVLAERVNISERCANAQKRVVVAAAAVVVVLVVVFLLLILPLPRTVLWRY